MSFSLSQAIQKLGYSTNSFKALVLKAKDSDGNAFADLGDELIDDKLPYWNIWSNVSPALWRLLSNKYMCTINPLVRLSSLGDTYNHNAQPPTLELPDRMYFLTSVSFSGTFYAGDYNFLDGIDHFRVFLKSKTTSHSSIGNPQPLQNMQGYQVGIATPPEGDYYFGFVVQSGEENDALNYEVEQLRFNTELRRLPKQGSVTTVNEVLYDQYFTRITGCSGSIVVQNSQDDITVRYRISYALVSGDIVTPVSGLNGQLYTTTISASDKNRYRDVEILLPTSIPIDTIPTNYYIIIEIVSATGTVQNWVEVPSQIYREN